MHTTKSTSGTPGTKREDGKNVLTADVLLGVSPVDSGIIVAAFVDNSTDNIVTENLTIETPNTEGKMAGTYNGTLTFTISY